MRGGRWLFSAETVLDIVDDVLFFLVWFLIYQVFWIYV